jgi:preprotein translocase subunit SecE
MAKPNPDSAKSGLWSELFHFALYKPNQGRIVRQLTFVAVAILGCLAAWELHRIRILAELFSGSRYAFLILFASIGLWFAYRVVNYWKFADFLIAVEAEMNKVSWPTKAELWKASLVVLFVIFFMALLLWVFDIFWTLVFQAIRIRYVG